MISELVFHGPGLSTPPHTLDFAHLYILLAPVHWLLGSSRSYSLLLAFNLLLISLAVPASFNYINIFYSQMKKFKKRDEKKSFRDKQRPVSTAGLHLLALS